MILAALATIAAVIGWRLTKRPSSHPNAPPPHTATTPRRHPNHTDLPHAPAEPPTDDAETQPTHAPASLANATEDDWKSPTTAAKLTTTLIHWAAQDPTACRTWILAQSESFKTQHIPDIAGSLIAEHPLDAFHLLNELPPSPLTDQMLRQTAMEIASQNPTAANDWANQQTDPATRDLLLSAVYCVLAENQPATAATNALKDIQATDQRDQVVVEILARWVQHDAPAAANFANHLTEPLITSAATTITSQWVAKDPNACANWLLTLPSSPARSGAFSTFVNYQIHHDRDQLTLMLPQLTDPALKSILDTALSKDNP